MLSHSVGSPATSIESVIERIFESRRITRTDQRWFMNALLAKDSLSREEQIQVDRVFEAVRKGFLRVVD